MNLICLQHIMTHHGNEPDMDKEYAIDCVQHFQYGSHRGWCYMDRRQIAGQLSIGVDVVHLALQRHSFVRQQAQAFSRFPRLVVFLSQLEGEYILSKSSVL